MGYLENRFPLYDSSDLVTYNSLCVYSEEETEIGRWIDNSPVYRKVILHTITKTLEADYFDSGINDLGTVVNYRVVFKGLDAGQGWFTNNYWSGGGVNASAISGITSDGRIWINTGRKDLLNTTCYIIIEYTKTTD